MQVEELKLSEKRLDGMGGGGGSVLSYDFLFFFFLTYKLKKRHNKQITMH